jgi:hypothetical protein
MQQTLGPLLPTPHGQRKNKLVAITAVMRKLIVICNAKIRKIQPAIRVDDESDSQPG